MKKSYKKLALALLSVAVITNVQAREENRDGLYQPKSPWPIAPVEDALVGTAGVLTLGQTDADPSGLVVAVPDAIPGVSHARGKNRDEDSCDSSCNKRKKNCEHKSDRSECNKCKKEKNCKRKMDRKECDTTEKRCKHKRDKDECGKCEKERCCKGTRKEVTHMMAQEDECHHRHDKRKRKKMSDEDSE